MSNIDKHDVQAVADLKAGYTLGHADVAILNELARIALASLEAEPVAYIFKHPAGRLFWSLTDESNKGQSDVMPVYTAQPAPVFVPDEMTREEYKRRFMEDDDFDDTFRGGWNACRAAMLHGAEPVSNRDELTDGWVACSKRMPSPSTGVIVAAPWQSAPGGYAMKWATNCPGHPDADIDGWIIPGASWSPTHWMPLPAAPQQEDIIC
ncbi:DUF551 domain-containing protein [Enterobacter hormaechei]|uniref:DUF551 domain-containing protein n=1 Tax=Enterobacter hormaechei TaxID=158836 RepID=UPI0007355DB1|nr:DUF551 domain-containing protein [Enterobacter hormaechei]KTI48543.1 hypothetical protein ASV04_15495 [Enterobacter hormaechei subsp. xiangfangensis]MBT1792857.1 DUF551 domain-containing protein [Enterobacter hormaechei subsp. xiangfangensis]MCM7379851.1 DUF551 domain-containing protein [Enterobacter hormaechei]CZW32358.1 Protein of uncharacterised function (DUF551) [Enterobacter hormaechei]